MKEIVVISGKGGTGKTSVTASFSVIAGATVVTADCDVDAADMHLLLSPDFKRAEDFKSGFLARIDAEACNGCGTCADVCRFSAVGNSGSIFSIIPLECEGCGYCARVCPESAILMEERNVGKWYTSNIKTGGIMVHARLDIGAENSGKLVARVKKAAKEKAEETRKSIVIVDGSPGIGCPVVSSLSGADFVVLVTEPTVSGLHDLTRVHALVEKFGLRSGCIINKADLNPGITLKIRDFLNSKGIKHLADLPYDEAFTDAMTEGKTIIETDHGSLRETLSDCWKKITQLIFE